jgi:type II secretory pathway component GspD/PulD (secretin)
MRNNPQRPGLPSGPTPLRRLAWAALACFAALGAAHAQDGGVQGPRAASTRQVRVSISFTGVDVREVLATIAEYTRLDIVVTPGATGNVTINLRDRQAEEAIRLVAAAAGLSVLRSGTSYIVGPPAEVKKAATELGQTVVMPLRFLTPTEARDLLARLAPNVAVEPAPRGVLLSGLTEAVSAARQALRELDVEPLRPMVPPPPSETEVLGVRFLDAAGVGRVLQEAFPQLRVTARDRTLILVGPAADLAAASRALAQLDVAPPEPAPVEPAPDPQEEAVVKLEYINAKTAEQSLTKALPGLKVVVGAESLAPPPALFNPLSLGFLGGSGSGGNSGGFSSLGSGGSGGVGAAGGSGGAAGGASGMGAGNTTQELDRAGRLILIGPASMVATARRLIQQMDVAPPRVNIEAEIVEVNADAFKELGIRWFFDDATGPSLNVPFGFQGGIGRSTGAGASAIDPNRGFHFGKFTAGDFGFRASLNALVTDNRARVLARPNISVMDNEDANVFIGDLVRFRGTTIAAPDVGTIQGTDAIPVGIALLVRPRVHSNGDVTLKVHPVVSLVTAIVDDLPQTSSREADTTVRLKRGDTFLIGGLQREERFNDFRKVPLLGDIPVLGQLFRSRTRTRRHTEIVIIVRVREVITDARAPEAPEGS